MQYRTEAPGETHDYLLGMDDGQIRTACLGAALAMQYAEEQE